MNTNAITQTELTLTEPLPLDQNPVAVYIASLGGIKTPGGRSQAYALRVIASILGSDIDRLNWGALRYQHTAAIRARLAQAYSPASANTMLSALRQTLKQAWLLGQMGAEEYYRAIELEPVKGETLPAGRELSQGEILALITTCKQDKNRNAGTRDAAIIGLMYAAGLRRDEMVKLTVASYDPDSGQLILTGKGKKQRTAYVTNGAQAALNDWLAIRGDVPGALFVPINMGGTVTSQTEHMKPQAIYDMLARRAKQAGIKNFSPHDLRRTFISHLLDAGADISTVSKMAGHANVQTTARYDRRPEEAKRKAASLLHVPY